MVKLALFLISFVLCYYESLTEDNSFEWDISNADHFTGFIYESSDYVKVNPEIKLKTKPDLTLCNFILTSKNGQELPFLVNLESSTKGIGNIHITGPVHLDNYEFFIKAKTCDHEIYSKELKIYLKKVTEEVPLWEKSVYNAIVNDDIRPGSEVIRVKAYELGRSAGNSICDYKIVVPVDAPFDIDGNGVVRSTNYLDARKHKNYVLRVMAIDCRNLKPRNSSVSVNIEVKRVCKFGWNGIFQQINYVPGSGIRRLGANIKFDACDESLKQCETKESMVQLILKNTETKMCDKDIISLRNQWNTCGVNNETAELLPSAEQFAREAFGSADSLTGIYSFDGNNTRWEIPTNIIPQNHFLGDNFTLSFWMKHDKLTDDNSHKKEQILCNSDGDGKNRHHYSLFLHNCKLIFLYRTEPSLKQVFTLTPAEWRFKSNEFCDSEWHHYSLVVEMKIDDNSFGVEEQQQHTNAIHRIKLFIDGESFPNDIDNPEIIDDLPMHEIPQVHFTKLVVGACWRSKSSNFIQHFRGQLSGMTVLRGQLESASVIECINKCHERLTFTGINKMAPGTSISINAMMSSMIITASKIEDIQKIIEQIGYINSRWKPLPGKRSIEINTTIKCLISQRTYDVPQKNVIVVVLPKEDNLEDRKNIPEEIQNKDYVLKVTGDPVIEIDSPQVVTPGIGQGLPILINVMINDLTSEGLGSLLLWGKPTLEGNRRRYRIKGVNTIESCLLSAHPILNNPHEYLSFSNNVIEDLSEQGIFLNVTNSSTGLIIEGSQSVAIYRFVLQRIVYFNNKLEDFNGKIFKLACSKNSAHGISNELVVELKISKIVKDNLKNTMTNVYNTDIRMHDDPLYSHDGIEHQHGLSEKASFKLPANSAKSDKNSSNIMVIFTVCGIIVVALIVLALLRVVRQKNQRLGIPFSRNLGPWVRLKPDSLGFLGQKEGSLRNSQIRKVLPVSATNGEMEWDNSEMYSSSLMDESLQITVNPLLDHEKTLRLINSKHLSTADMQLDAEERSLDGLPDEYDGKSEDFREFDDDMTIEEDCNSLTDDIDIPKFYQNGQSLSQNAINEKSRSWFGRLNIHQNPRYSLDNAYSK